jgi:signal transduction histidine kinase
MEAVQIAQARGRGWTDFRIENPVTGQIEAKSSYVELVEGIVIGCGIYVGDGHGNNRARGSPHAAAPRLAQRRAHGLARPATGPDRN